MSTPASGETKPLLTPTEGSKGSKKLATHYTVALISPENPYVVDTMTYDVSVLKTWQVFAISGIKTSWQKASTWYMMGSLMIVSLSVAVLLLLLNGDPGQLKGSKFKEIGLFLRVFVGLLLGFFLTSSVNRWYESVHGFMELFDAVRNLQMQFLALGVADQKRFQCIRYGCISGKLLDDMLTIRLLPEADRVTRTQGMWDELVNEEAPTNADLFHLTQRNRLTPTEGELLQAAEDPAGMMWYWVASLVGRLAQDGDIPPMASPTYGRIMNLAQTAHGGIRHVKQSVKVQAPFIYVHMLSSLVHLNNLISAVSFGISLGTAMASWLIYNGYRGELGETGIVDYARVTHSDIVADMENLVVMLFIGVFGPLIYLSLLDVALDIAQPFASAECGIPTHRFLSMLDSDLDDAQTILSTPPGWEPPYFKKPA